MKGKTEEHEKENEEVSLLAPTYAVAPVAPLFPFPSFPPLPTNPRQAEIDQSDLHSFPSFSSPPSKPRRTDTEQQQLQLQLQQQQQQQQLPINSSYSLQDLQEEPSEQHSILRKIGSSKSVPNSITSNNSNGHQKDATHLIDPNKNIMAIKEQSISRSQKHIMMTSPRSIPEQSTNGSNRGSQRQIFHPSETDHDKDIGVGAGAGVGVGVGVDHDTHTDLNLTSSEVSFLRKFIQRIRNQEEHIEPNSTEFLGLLAGHDHYHDGHQKKICTSHDHRKRHNYKQQQDSDQDSEYRGSDGDNETVIVDTIFGTSKYTTRMLEEDTFAFMISAPVFSTPWWTGVFVCLLETGIFILILINSFDIRGSPENPLGIPASVSPQVAIAQFAAMFIAVASQDDIRSAIKYFYEGYRPEGIGATFAGSKSQAQWFFAVSTQFVEGALGIVATFFLVVTSDEVIDLLLNFTAVEFVTILDNNAFVLAKEGFLGKRNMVETEIVSEKEYSLPRSRMVTPKGQICTLIATFIFIIVGWGLIFTDQTKGKYTVQTLYVQFDDSLDLGLGAYSGFFNLDVAPGSIRINRIRYNAANREGFFGYCESDNVWTFSLEGDHPCDNPIMKSSRTILFDIMKVAEGQWYGTKNAQEQLYFPMDGFQIDAGCLKDTDCGGAGRGICRNNRCECEDEYFGALCLYTREKVCKTIAVNEQFSKFQGNREFSTEFSLLEDEDGHIMEAYHHPVYYHTASDGNLEVVLYLGVRWGLTAALGDTVDDLRKMLSAKPFHAMYDLPMLEFYTETVSFNTPLDTVSPIIQSWKKVEPAALSSTSQVGPVTTRFICGICSEDHPCRYGNECNDGRCVQSCDEDGTCVCGNGAYGRLCQTAPLGDGKCDSYFNTSPFQYDGGDCCEATCLNSDTQVCGYINSKSIENVNIGFTECVDPFVMKADCSGKTCWAPRSRTIPLLSAENTALIHLSANGLIIAVAEPALDAVRVFDQEDSRWVQRGSILEGPVGSNFGKKLAFDSLPGAIIGRRVGRVPVILAMGMHVLGKAGVRVVRWEPNDLDWRAVGDDLDICVDADKTCDLNDVDITRTENRLTLSAVRMDNFGLVYRHTLSETGRNPWILQYYANGEESRNEFDSRQQIYGMTSVSPFALRGDGASVMYSYGLSIEIFDLSDDEDFINVGNTMANAQNLRLTTTPEILSFNFQNIDIATQLIAIAKNLNWERNVSYTRDITSVKLSPDGDSFLLSMPINSSQTLAGSQIIATLRYQFENLNPVATWAKNFTTPVLSEAQVNDGITTFQVSSDASSFVIRERSDDGRNTVRVFSYDRDKFYFLPIGPTRDDHGGDVSLNYDGSVLFQSLIGLDPAYGIAPKCGSEMTKYRLAITLDEKPELLSWTIDTYQSVGPLVFSDKLIRSCDGCYFDNDRFGKGLVAEDICVSIDNELCGRFRFEARSGFRPGAGLRLSREGSEVFSHIGNSTNEISFFMGNPDDCKIEELKCDDHESHILFILKFDTLPSETYWSMEDLSGNLIDSGGNYTTDEHSGRTELYQMCAPKDSDYKLTLEDRSGRYPDGICCDDGNGGYDLYVDFVKIYTREGERAFRFDTVVFNNDGVVEEPVPITFEFQLDGYPDETLWTIQLHDRTLLFTRQFYRPSQKNELVSEIVYLSPGQDYELGIGDGYGDGFCCGSGDGYFRIYDGDFADSTKLLTTGSGEFTGSWMYVNFTVPARGSDFVYVPWTMSPTQAPLLIVSPTQAPNLTFSPTQSPSSINEE